MDRRTNGYFLELALAFALRNARVKHRNRIALTEEERYSVAADALRLLKQHGTFKWLDEPAPESPVGSTGPSFWKPD